MEANAGLVAGSHKRNELVLIRPESEVQQYLTPNVTRKLFSLSGLTLHILFMGVPACSVVLETGSRFAASYSPSWIRTFSRNELKEP